MMAHYSSLQSSRFGWDGDLLHSRNKHNSTIIACDRTETNMKKLILAALAICAGCTPAPHTTVEECVLHVSINAQLVEAIAGGVEACRAIYDQDYKGWPGND